MDRISTALAVLIVAVAAFLLGATLAVNPYRTQAIEHGAAYYHPQTGDFVWKESENGKM